MAHKRGRPPTPLNPDASRLARLGAELRKHRVDEGLTLQELADRIASVVGRSVTPQHISEVERAKVTPSQTFVKACDTTLRTGGAILLLLPAAIEEREARRDERTEARRAARQAEADPAVRCEADSDAGDDVEPTSRRGLLGAGAAAAIGLSTAAPAAARYVDPALADHWAKLLSLLGRHDAAFGPHEVLSNVCHELGIIAEHRSAARDGLRVEIMSVEARWSIYAGWLCEDTGDTRGRDAMAERALRLAREADDPDVMAWTRARQAQWSDPPRAIRLAEAGLRTPRAGAHTRALCAVRAAHGHALMGDAKTASRLITEAQTLLDQQSPPPPNTALPSTDRLVRCWEARCWAALEPAKGAELYEDVLCDWPRGWTRDEGLYRARLARARADAGEQDRAQSEGRKALAIARATNSTSALRELKQLGVALNS